MYSERKTMSEHVDLKEKLLADFKLLQQNLNGQSRLPFHQQQIRAMEDFSRVGFPTTKMEEWRFTPLLSYLQKNYSQHLQTNESAFTPEVSKVLLPKSLPVPRLVFINGMLSNEWSTVNSSEYIATSMIMAREKHGDLFEKYYAKNLDSG